MHIGVKLTLITLFIYHNADDNFYHAADKNMNGLKECQIRGFILKKWKGHSIETDENLKSIREIIIPYYSFQHYIKILLLINVQTS